MTRNAAGGEDLVAGGDYVQLEKCGADGVATCQAEASSSGCCGGGADAGVGGWWWSCWWWAKLVLVVLFVAVLGAVFFKWVGPFFMDKEVIPIIIWERETFSTTMLALIVFGSLAIFPSFLIPSTPSMWIAGMTFGYGYGFLLTIGSVAIGVTIPYFIGSLFCHRIHAWLERYPKKASIIRLAGEGSWFNQFRAVTLIRISPFPYVVYNYCAMATDVKYGPYLLGTIVGMIPEIFVALYTGILIRTLADASHDQHSLSGLQIVFNVAGFCITVVSTVIITLYAKKRLKELQMEEELLLQ
ncbi:SNARE associated Golgi protein family [Striga hermonthica]|uniref:SNARE associated Golgi protein family n=1 Tax=Striga hermonthica TaxID=68872 RepID=A0A9N7NZH5_STRHE|nr:SNARE associated Golgi protein family [Striga hermonthica]